MSAGGGLGWRGRGETGHTACQLVKWGGGEAGRGWGREEIGYTACQLGWGLGGREEGGTQDKGVNRAYSMSAVSACVYVRAEATGQKEGLHIGHTPYSRAIPMYS